MNFFGEGTVAVTVARRGTITNCGTLGTQSLQAAEMKNINLREDYSGERDNEKQKQRDATETD